MTATAYNYEMIFGTLLVLCMVSLFVERALALLFESKPYKKYLEGKGLKPFIVFAVCYLVVRQYDLDALSLVINRGSFSMGPIITAAVIAGGSKGVMSIWVKIKEAWGMK